MKKKYDTVWTNKYNTYILVNTCSFSPYIIYIYTQKLQIMVVYFIVTFSIFSAMSELIGEKSPDSFTLETYLGQVCGNLNTQSCIGTRTHDHISRIRLVSPRQTPFVLSPPMLAHDEILILDFQVYSIQFLNKNIILSFFNEFKIADNV